MKGEGNNQNYCQRCNHNRIKCFHCEGWGHMACECPRTPLNGNQREVTVTSNVTLRSTIRWWGNKDINKYEHTGEGTWYHKPSPLDG